MEGFFFGKVFDFPKKTIYSLFSKKFDLGGGGGNMVFFGRHFFNFLTNKKLLFLGCIVAY